MALRMILLAVMVNQFTSGPKGTEERSYAPAPCPRTIHLVGAAVVFIAFLASTFYYLVWRVAIINWAFWWIGVPLLLAELFGIVNTLGLQYTVWPRAEPVINASDDPASLPIYIMIPTVNEGVAILELTIRGALSARARYLQSYPEAQVTIVLCNDGRVAGVKDWSAVEALAERLGVTCITRTVPGGAKAGNIEHARQIIGATGNTLIALFDADMVAEPDFLIKTVAPFADPTIGWVQTGQYYRNQGSAVARWAHDQQLLFYRLICVGKAAVNSAFICGTNVVIRAAALDTIGGMPQNSVTEDLAASILLHPKWRSLYLTDILAQGLGPEDLASYFSQQRRWATGTFGIFFRHWRVMFLPWHRGLTLPQRLQYLNCCIHFLSGFRDLICLAAPLAYLSLGLPAFRAFGFTSFLTHFLPYWAFSFFVFWYATHGKAGFRVVLHGSILGFGCFPIFISSFVNALFQKRIRFVITSKRRGAAHGWQQLYPQAAMLVLCVAGMCRFAWRRHWGWLGLMSELWMLYVVLLLLGMLWLGIAENPLTEQRLLRAGKRFGPMLLGMGIITSILFVCVQMPIGQTVPANTEANAAALCADNGSHAMTFALNRCGQAIGIADSQTCDLLRSFHTLSPGVPDLAQRHFISKLHPSPARFGRRT
jgi:cellulose synthase/poly-beta-1,6-N-acetylglucosamine synthase-like glycosyltransferase